MKTPGLTPLSALTALCIALTMVLAKAAPVTEADKQFLARYEKVRGALVADDLGAAKSAAGDLGNEGAELAKSSSLKEARAAFERLSEQAKHLAAGQAGYYVVYCPMLKKDWVQTSATISNPYGGKDMVTCGEIKK